MKGLLQHSYLISRPVALGSTNSQTVFLQKTWRQRCANTNTISHFAMKTVSGVFGGLSTVTRTLRLERDFQCLHAAQMKFHPL